MFKLIIFDFDGPILDSFGMAKTAIFKARDSLIDKGLVPPKRLPLPDENLIIQSWGYPSPLAIKKLFPLITDQETVLMMEQWLELQPDQEIRLISGAKETLKWLKDKGLLAGMLTSRVNNLEYHLQKNGILEYFNFIQSWLHPEASKLNHNNHFLESTHKPDPAVFENIIIWSEAKGIAKNEIILIDDSLIGLETARAVGVGFLGVCTGPMESKEKWQIYGGLSPKNVLNSISELPDWLQNNNLGVPR